MNKIGKESWEGKSMVLIVVIMGLLLFSNIQHKQITGNTVSSVPDATLPNCNCKNSVGEWIVDEWCPNWDSGASEFKVRHRKVIICASNVCSPSSSADGLAPGFPFKETERAICPKKPFMEHVQDWIEIILSPLN